MIWGRRVANGFGGSKYLPLFELDPHPFARGGSFAIFSVSVMHLYLAALLLYQPLSGNATCMRALLVAFKALHAPDGEHFVAAWMNGPSAPG